MKFVRVWDLPIRLFHWLLVIAIIGLFTTGKLGGNWMQWHERIGYFVLGLILFRVIWGVVGNYHARFSNFVRGPSSVWMYFRSLIKGESPKHVGHNPMGALSVVVFLIVIGVQAVTGLFADDDIMLRGPYASTVGGKLSSFFTNIHKLNSDVILVLIGVHLAAILFYFFVKKDNLTKPMVTGVKSSMDAHFEAKMHEKARPYWLSWFVVTLAAAVVYLVASRALLPAQ